MGEAPEYMTLRGVGTYMRWLAQMGVVFASIDPAFAHYAETGAVPELPGVVTSDLARTQLQAALIKLECVLTRKTVRCANRDFLVGSGAGASPFAAIRAAYGAGTIGNIITAADEILRLNERATYARTVDEAADIQKRSRAYAEYVDRYCDTNAFMFINLAFQVGGREMANKYAGTPVDEVIKTIQCYGANIVSHLYQTRDELVPNLEDLMDYDENDEYMGDTASVKVGVVRKRADDEYEISDSNYFNKRSRA
ncbi:hypothetical protein D0Z00_001078 [Geotrichum galactomycetum]|uniref:Uncharacterized protein n=1 Tax=Geotrichum galactomycetum TaxID=27317 RepID=A0ACB6V7Z3_9ASCO|nr:hypothetical protein D0Z00_001078 [Geotrichum candidum]